MHRAAIAAILVLGACTARRGAGWNPNPVTLRRPMVAPLSAVAALGRDLFNSPILSASGHVACASCHRADHVYAAADATPSRLAGSVGNVRVSRAVPSLRYVDRMPAFTIGPPVADNDDSLVRPSRIPFGVLRKALRPDSTVAPRGGLFWDGRANTLQDQAFGPLFNPGEMANHDAESVARRLLASPFAARLRELFGADIARSPARLVDEAMFAIARFQVEDSSFHPYDSRYDRWLEGTDSLTPDELRGLKLFEDPARGNCAACHWSRPLRDGTPPAFTDGEYEALGVPRNDALPVNRDSAYVDLGLCGPTRHDLASATQYCGMFRTPSLRNVATRQVFFHNGVYTTLEQVVDFYDLRDPVPDHVYGGSAVTRAGRAGDLPAIYRANLDTVDAPFGRTHSSMNASEIRELIAFLRTLTDGSAH